MPTSTSADDTHHHYASLSAEPPAAQREVRGALPSRPRSGERRGVSFASGRSCGGAEPLSACGVLGGGGAQQKGAAAASSAALASSSPTASVASPSPAPPHRAHQPVRPAAQGLEWAVEAVGNSDVPPAAGSLSVVVARSHSAAHSTTPNAEHRLRVQTVSNEEVLDDPELFATMFDLYVAYQTTIHDEHPESYDDDAGYDRFQVCAPPALCEAGQPECSQHSKQPANVCLPLCSRQTVAPMRKDQ
jgi:hypothetical protein